MKPQALIPIIALTALLASSCDKNSSEVAKQLADLERKANDATQRQLELEQQIENQKLAAERDAIERERMQIEDARLDLERRQDETAATEAEKIRQREEALAAREGKLEMLQSTLDEKNDSLRQLDQKLTDRELELAGREALSNDKDKDDNGDQENPVGDFGMFHEALTPYGSWFETPDYGYVWQPAIIRNSLWRPYTRGRWACSDSGWIWISDEPFGWATYHYGRWALLRNRGWVWVPGSEWAPSWVSWRHSGTCIGWAPLPPETLAFRGHHWDSSVDVTFSIGALWFSFVEIRHFGGPIHNHCLPYTQNNIYIQQTINITNIHVHNRRIFCGGPKYGDVSRQTARRPPFYRLEMERHGRPDRDPSSTRPRIHGDRMRVTAPNIDVAWNEKLRPGKIKGRMDSITVERTEALSPEISNRFRQSREDNHRKAEQSINDLGGQEKFNQRRLEQLAENRRKAGEQTRRTVTTRDSNPPPKQEKIAGKTDKTSTRIDERQVFPPKDPGKSPKDDAERIRKQREQDEQERQREVEQHKTRIDERQREEDRRKADKTSTRIDERQVFPPKDPGKTQRDEAERIRKQREQAEQERLREAEQHKTRIDERQREEDRSKIEKPSTRIDERQVFPPKDLGKSPQENAERIRKQREQAEQERQREAEQHKTRIDERQQQDALRQQARSRQLQEAQREQTRQQQEALRQQARSRQLQEAQREQTRQQQEALRQQERSRQLQDDEMKKRDRNR